MDNEQTQQFALHMMMLLGAVIAVLAISGAAVLIAAGRRGGHDIGETVMLTITRMNILQILTVVTVVMSVFVLTIIGRLTPDAAVSVFSGIAGYVLGGLGRTQGGTDRTSEPPANSN